MFEVDLLLGEQGAGARTRKRKPGKRRTPPGARTLRDVLINGWVLASCLVALGSLGVTVRLAVGTSQGMAGLDAALREAIQDSARAAEHSRTRLDLERRSDSLAARVALIEEIDARRYDWPHLLEEVAAALPEGVWITRISEVASGGPRVRIRVAGATFDNFGLTRLWNALEASFFLKNVELVSAEHRPAQAPGPDGDAVDPHHFVIEADWEDPSDGILDFVPIDPIEESGK